MRNKTYIESRAASVSIQIQWSRAYTTAASALLALTALPVVLADTAASALLALVALPFMLADTAASALLAVFALPFMLADTAASALLAFITLPTVLAETAPSTLLAPSAPVAPTLSGNTQCNDLYYSPPRMLACLQRPSWSAAGETGTRHSLLMSAHLFLGYYLRQATYNTPSAWAAAL